MQDIDKYDPSTIEPLWLKKWQEAGLYVAPTKSGPAGGAKRYILIEFPYPSGERLHVGHGRSYTALDALSRKLRMQNFNVLYPIGWDAFGLPAENYAIKMGVNPVVTTAQNIANAKAQAKRWGLSFDWTREINTTDPKYYKWTQWIFLKLLKKGLAYRAEVPVNWCPFCKTNLADEEVLADGTHERCGNQTEKRRQKQWILKITAYADRLLEDLKTVNYLPKIRLQQENWIGRSEGAEISFRIANQGNTSDGGGISKQIRVFTTAIDTIFGTTFMVLSPEYANGLVNLVPEDKKESVSKYIETSLKRSELERQKEEKTKTGQDTGLKAVNPFNGVEIPIFVADYVLASYGTGAVMGVPGHDARDCEFAKRYNLPVIPVIKPKDRELEGDFWVYSEIKENPESAILVDSGEFTGMTAKAAKEKMVEELITRKLGKKSVNYHLRDWVFSRQHYWGEPIPVVYCVECAKRTENIEHTTEMEGVQYAIVPVTEDQLPVELPYVEKYQPSGTGESPLAAMTDWVNTTCPVCGGPAKRETDTMPNWAGSNWYFMRYCDPQNNEKIADSEKLKYWLPVDLYNGGMEHTTLHLLYSRFIYKFLFDIGVVPTTEPYARRTSHGVVLGPDGYRMSKSRGNVINPDDIVNQFGADTFRVYESFMGPFDQTITWKSEGVEGCFRFLKRVWQLALAKTEAKSTAENLLRSLHKTIKKVGEDLDHMKFNTAIASMMEFINEWQDDKTGLSKEDAKKFLLILAPFAPFITEELWSKLGKNFSIHQTGWPKFEENLLQEDITTIIVQVNGKLRGKIGVESEKAKKQTFVEQAARQNEKIKQYLMSQAIKQVIFVPGKLINFVIK